MISYTYLRVISTIDLFISGFTAYFRRKSQYKASQIFMRIKLVNTRDADKVIQHLIIESRKAEQQCDKKLE
jgi:hypothetical protein